MGVTNIIDLGNEYYLVAFSHEEDQSAALMNGPWFIYDHYLTVKEWSPNFHPTSDTIKKVAVWVRIPGLPIEYYDAKVLKSIGDRIGRKVKVDKNTLKQERGKYARLCVEVDLTKPLLAMFMIKERKYNVEYEGLHLLCTTCGKFGHYKEGCPDILKKSEQTNGGTKGDQSANDDGHSDLAGSNVAGPWVVVKKTKRTRKGKEREDPVGARISPATGDINGDPHLKGSRFVSLSEDSTDMNKDLAIISDERNGENSMQAHEKIEEVNNGENTERGNNMSGNSGTHNKGKSSGSKMHNEKIIKGGKLAARGSQVFKNKNGNSLKIGSDNLQEVLREKEISNGFEARIQRPNNSNNMDFAWPQTSNNMEIQRETMEGTNKSGYEINQTLNINMGQMTVITPNMPRPPNIGNTHPMNEPFLSHKKGEEPGETEEFVDANEHGSSGYSDSEMEVVGETPISGQ
jgi:hypothetical protein